MFVPDSDPRLNREDNGTLMIEIMPQQQQILSLLAQGCTSREIARYLKISPRMVKQQMCTLFMEFLVATRILPTGPLAAKDDTERSKQTEPDVGSTHKAVG